MKDRPTKPRVSRASRGARQGLDGHTAPQVRPSPLSAREPPYQQGFPRLRADKVYGRAIARESLVAPASRRARDSRRWGLWSPGAKPVPKAYGELLARSPRDGGVSPSPAAGGTGCVPTRQSRRSHPAGGCAEPWGLAGTGKGLAGTGKGLNGIRHLQPQSPKCLSEANPSPA